MCGDVAQLGERQLCKLEATGSNPVISTNCAKPQKKPIPVSVTFVLHPGFLASLANTMKARKETLFSLYLEDFLLSSRVEGISLGDCYSPENSLWQYMP